MSDNPESEEAGPSDTEIQASLNRAIDTLEDMLSKRHGLDVQDAGIDDEADVLQRPQPQSGEQYTIPLLNDVVFPGTGPDLEPVEITRPPPSSDLLSAPGMEVYRHLFERLASEIEIIVETGVEEALEAASKAIMKRVTDHIEIVLPEILDEIAHLKSSKGNDP